MFVHDCARDRGSVFISVCTCVSVCTRGGILMGTHLAVCTQAHPYVQAWGCVCARSDKLVGTCLAACARASLRMCAGVVCACASGPRRQGEDAALCPHLSRVDVITSASRVWQETQN